MTVTREIPLDALDRFSTRLPAVGAADVTIEVLDDDVGDQIQADRLPWHALWYDAATGIVEVSVGGRDTRIPVVLRHHIHDPESVWVEEAAEGVRTIAITGRDGARTLVRFHPRRALTASGEEPGGVAVT